LLVNLAISFAQHQQGLKTLFENKINLYSIVF
jgi:hypothetical protein